MADETRLSRILLRKLLRLSIGILFFVRITLRYNNRIDVEKPCVIAVFHDEMLPVLDHFKNTDAVFLASGNHVGFSLSLVLISWGYKIVYGSPRHGGKEALKKLAEEIQQGKIVIITPDGSKGPRHQMKAGAVVLAKKTNVPLYLVSPNYTGLRMRFLWDRFLYPAPFSKVTFKCNRVEIGSELSRKETDQKIIEATEILQSMANHIRWLPRRVQVLGDQNPMHPQFQVPPVTK